jgi:sugar phosphate isomerase/epimerase
MKTSVSMYSMNQYVKHEAWSIFDFINFAKAIGVKGIELLDMYWTDKENEIHQVVEYIEKMGLSVSAYDVSNDFIKSSAEERESEANRVIEAIKTAKVLNTDVVRVFCGNLKEGIEYEQGKAWILEGFRKCLHEAEKEEVHLAIENHGLFAGKASQVKELIEEINSPYINSTFDTGNFLLVGDHPVESAKLLKKYVVHVHFKDFIKKKPQYTGKAFTSLNGEKYVGVVAGDGLVDLESVVEELMGAGYDGWYSIEYEGEDDSRESVKQAIFNIQRYLDSEGGRTT